MKRTAYLAAAAAAAVIAGGGTALAAEKAVPEFGSYEYTGALETGGLPAEPGSALTPSGPRRKGIGDTGTYVYLLDPLTGGQAGFPGGATPRVEVGGITYRVGVDTQ